MAEVYFDPSLGGDGLNLTDEMMYNGGHRLYFVRALRNEVSVAEFAVGRAEAANAFAEECEQYRNEVVAIRDSIESDIIAGGQIFPTVEEGREAVSDGQYYYVASADPNITRSLYRRISESESEHIQDDPSAAFVESLSTGFIDTITPINNRTSVLFETPQISAGERELNVEVVSFDLKAERGYWEDTGLPWRPGGVYEDLIANLPTTILLGERQLENVQWTFDLKAASGTFSDGLPWLPGGALDDLFSVHEIDDIDVQLWSFDLRPVSGFKKSTGGHYPPIRGIEAAKNVIVFRSNAFSVYVHQSGDTFVEWEFVLSNNPNRNALVWRLNGKFHAVSSSEMFTRIVSIGFNGEYEIAVSFSGRADFIGGAIHGNEEMPSVDSFRIHIDGVETAMTGRHTFNRLDLFQHTIGYLPGPSGSSAWDTDKTPMLDIHKHITFRDGETVFDAWVEHLIGGYTVVRAYFGMDCIPWGTKWSSAGEGAVHSAARYPRWSVEDVSVAEFPEIATGSNRLLAWGDTYSYEVKMAGDWDADVSRVRVDNRADRRKLYPSFYDGLVTEEGDIWTPRTTQITSIRSN